MGLVIQGRAYAGGKITETSVRVENGTIVAVGGRETGPGDEIIKLDPRQILLPAGVEGLCCLRDWGESPKDTAETVSKAALAAGVTVVSDQANVVPRINTPELAAKRRDTVAASSYTDFSVAAHPPLDFNRLNEYIDAGISVIDHLMWDLMPWNTPHDIDPSRERFQKIAELGFPSVIFLDELSWQQTPLHELGEERALSAFLRRAPPELHARLMVSLPTSVETILKAKEQLPNLMIQSALHAVLISKPVAQERIGSAAFCVPPLRGDAEQQQLLELAKSGAIDIIVSHHAPHRMVDKYSTCAPIPGELTPKAGFSAMDYTYPLLMTRLGLEAACRTYAENPARHMGLKKGKIEKGYEGDLIIVEEDAGIVETNLHVSKGKSLTQEIWKVEPADFFSKAQVTPFVGERLLYKVKKTFLRGEEAYDAETKRFTRREVRQIQIPRSYQ